MYPPHFLGTNISLNLANCGRGLPIRGNAQSINSSVTSTLLEAIHFLGNSLSELATVSKSILS